MPLRSWFGRRRQRVASTCSAIHVGRIKKKLGRNHYLPPHLPPHGGHALRLGQPIVLAEDAAPTRFGSTTASDSRQVQDRRIPGGESNGRRRRGVYASACKQSPARKRA